MSLSCEIAHSKKSPGKFEAMDRRTTLCLGMMIAALPFLPGCGDPGPAPTSAPGNTSAPTGGSRPLVFVGFDASEPLVEALQQGKLQGLVVQKPLKIGELGVKTLVAKLENRPVESKVSTGEAMVTPESLSQPDITDLLRPPTAENTNKTSGGPKTKKYRVMVIPKGTTHEFWKTIHAGALKAAEELGNVEIIWQGPQKEDDRVQQIQLVQSAVALGVDGIVLAPLDSRALVAPVEAAIARGIPVVVMDSGLESSKIVSTIATDNYHGGVLAAERIGELLKGEGRVILLRYAVGSQSTEEREKGFTDTLAKKFPKIRLVSDSEYSGATSDQAQQKAQSLITRYRGQFDAIFCVNESATFGTLRALDGAGMLARRP
jgi:ribose transport system substrate-binding protein